MVSKAEKKRIKSLRLKKNRLKEGLFLIEGFRIVKEAVSSNVQIKKIIATEEGKNQIFGQNEYADTFQTDIVPIEDLKEITTLDSPPSAIALGILPDENDNISLNNGEWAIFLENIQDPSNAGAILRTADWFGVKKIFCSKETTDLWQPKVVRASMGSIFRMEVHFTSLKKVIVENDEIPAIATVMDGENLRKFEPPQGGILCFGNEGNGLSREITDQCNHHLTIPRNGQTESLNVAVSAGIFLYHLAWSME